MSAPDLAVEYRTVKSLVPYANNARRHSRDQIATIADSITKFGWTAPILVDGANGVVAGHGRLEAAKKLRMVEVPVIELGGLSEAEKRAYLIADNQLAIDAGWDFDVLGGELRELNTAGFDMPMLGFNNLASLMAPPGEGTGPAEPSSRGQGAPSLQFNVIFEDEDQRRVWVGFLRKLKARYPDDETLGARLYRFLIDGGFVAAR